MITAMQPHSSFFSRYITC